MTFGLWGALLGSWREGAMASIDDELLKSRDLVRRVPING